MNPVESVAELESFVGCCLSQQHRASFVDARLRALVIHAQEALASGFSVGRAAANLMGLVTAFPPLIVRDGTDDETLSQIEFADFWRSLLLDPFLEGVVGDVQSAADRCLVHLADASARRRLAESAERSTFGDDADGLPEEYFGRLSDDEHALVQALQVVLARVEHRPSTGQQALHLSSADLRASGLEITIFVAGPMSNPRRAAAVAPWLDSVCEAAASFGTLLHPTKTENDPLGLIRLRTVRSIARADYVVLVYDGSSQGLAFDLSCALALAKPVLVLELPNDDSPRSPLIDSGSETGLQTILRVPTIESVESAIRLGIGTTASMVFSSAELHARVAKRPRPSEVIGSLADYPDDAWLVWMNRVVRNDAGATAITLQQLLIISERIEVPVQDLVSSILQSLFDRSNRRHPMRRHRPSVSSTSTTPTSGLTIGEYRALDVFRSGREGRRLTPDQFASLAHQVQGDRRVLASRQRSPRMVNPRDWSRKAQEMGYL